MKYLLILSCSGAKKQTKAKIPAIEIYTGVNYKVLNKLKREGKFPKNLEMVIISAQHGFLLPENQIESYDRKMDRRQAQRLKPSILGRFSSFFLHKNHREIFVNLGKTYRDAMEGFETFVPSKTSIIFAEGGIGMKMKQMKEWILKLESIPPK